jgi:hypothetical protein
LIFALIFIVLSSDFERRHGSLRIPRRQGRL